MRSTRGGAARLSRHVGRISLIVLAVAQRCCCRAAKLEFPFATLTGGSDSRRLVLGQDQIQTFHPELGQRLGKSPGQTQEERMGQRPGQRLRQMSGQRSNQGPKQRLGKARLRKKEQRPAERLG